MSSKPETRNAKLESRQRLEEVVRLLARPIEFASRDAPARLSTIKNLGGFVADQVVQALARGVFTPRVETDLLALRQLFSDYDSNVLPEERRRRLAQARVILDRLRSEQYIEHPSRPLPRAQDLSVIPIRFAKGVGPKRAVLLETLGVRTVEDALWYLPWRYEDRSIITPISGLRPGSQGTICGTVHDAGLRQTARRGMTVLEVTVGDASGSISCVYFNQPFLEKVFTPGTRVMTSGTVKAGRWGWNDLRMEAPHYELLGEESETPLHVGRIVPIYHETKGLTSRHLRTVIKGLLDEYAGAVEELIPPALVTRQGFSTASEALAAVHFPPPRTALPTLDRGTTKAHQRLAFEEFFVLEVALATRQRSVKQEVKGIRFDVRTPLLSRLQSLLPFAMTAAQRRVLSEIIRDMDSSRPMNRLIQGDVGCGKTVIALQAMVIACGSGCQAALMAPTEILAEQHFLNLRDLLTAVGLRAVLLKSGGTPRMRTAAIREIESGEANVVIGTHALIQKDVRFARLGLAVIDEQHRFGVLQRKTLHDKGCHPDVLVLTATPIPRTLAMTVYGDLDVSVIDMLPPGRKPIRTLLFAESQRRRAYQLVRDELQGGRQAYVVYPLVEESEKSDLQAALQGAERLQAEVFAGFHVGVLHGRMKTAEKERTMAAFKAGEIHLLVATTVIEVGIDVPNASVMLVEHADRFGLAQLHQLRGRVGRGAQQSSCLLLRTGRGSSSSPSSQAAQQSLAKRRLEALVKSSDGFVIAEEDLKIRGPGEFFGVRQWGLPEFRAANLIRDGAILDEARREAFALLAQDPELTAPGHQALRKAMLRRWKDKLDLGSVS